MNDTSFNPAQLARVSNVVAELRDLDLHRLETSDIDVFLVAFDRQHRTDQQNIYRLFVALTEHLAAKTPEHFDARNIASVYLAKRIVETTPEWEREKHLPYI